MEWVGLDWILDRFGSDTKALDNVRGMRKWLTLVVGQATYL